MNLLFAVDKSTSPIFFATDVIQGEKNYGVIRSATGKVGGKITYKNKVIKRGKNINKSNETSPLEQAILEMKSKINEVMDKGYKTSIMYETLYDDEMFHGKCEYFEDLEVFLINKKTAIMNFFLKNDIRNNTFPNSDPMPMLAQVYKSDKIRITDWFMQRKLNGVRCLMFKKEGKIVAISRKGKDYKITKETNPDLLKEVTTIFNNYPNVILDGELFIKDMPLGQILSRVKDVSHIERNDLQYHIYDIIAPLKFRNRLNFLIEVSRTFILSERVKFVETLPIMSLERLNNFETKAIQDNYEGVILRSPDAYYASGYRSENLLKLKRFIDEEFKIVSGKEKDKGDIDTFIFYLRAKNGALFGARPKGTRAEKQQYLENLEKLKGTKATVRYQELTEYGIPHQAFVLAIRDYE